MEGYRTTPWLMTDSRDGATEAKRHTGEANVQDPKPRIATRHHTHEEQLAAVCRVWGKQGEALLAELDDCPKAMELRRFAADLRQAGGDETGLRGSGRLRLVE